MSIPLQNRGLKMWLVATAVSAVLSAQCLPQDIGTTVLPIRPQSGQYVPHTEVWTLAGNLKKVVYVAADGKRSTLFVRRSDGAQTRISSLPPEEEERVSK